MRISTRELQNLAINTMQERQRELSDAQLQVATGRSILRPSDNPTGSARVLDLSQVISVHEQFQRNANLADVRLSAEETALIGAANVLQRVRELAVQGLNGTYSVNDRSSIALEVRQLADQLVEVANTKDANGEYIFAGFQSQTRPFSDDGVGNYTYNGDEGQRMLQVGPDRQVAVGDPGTDVFMRVPGSANNMFRTLYDLAVGLEAGAPSAASLTEIDQSIENIVRIRTHVGSRHNGIDQQRQVNDNLLLESKSTISAIRDLDYAEAVGRLNLLLAGLEAAQKSYVRIQGLSLFNFLN